MTTAQAIFSSIQGLNARKTTVSSVGTGIDSQARQMQEDKLDEVIRVISDKNSLAYKIATTAVSFTEKQMWVIAFELAKNTEYASAIMAEATANAEYAEAKKQKRSDKRKAAAARVQNAAEIKANAVNDGNANFYHETFGYGKLVNEAKAFYTIDFGGVTKMVIKSSVKSI